MALIEEIKVPLLAVNDTTLTVVELSHATGAKISKGDSLLVFETSKTTYDVEAPADGFVQYLCVAGQDYAVGDIAARIYSDQTEARTAAAPTPGQAAASHPATNHAAPTPGFPAVASGYAAPTSGYAAPAFAPAAEPLAHWDGEPLFSLEAGKLIETNGLDKTLFRGRDFISARDVLQLIQPSTPSAMSLGNPAPSAHPAPAAPGTKQPSPIAPGTKQPPLTAIDPLKATAHKLSSAKKREIEYLSEVQNAGLTSTIHTYVETEDIFVHLNRSLRYLKDSLLPVIIYETARLLADYPRLNAWFAGDAIAHYKEVSPGFAIDIDKGLKVAKVAGAGQKSLQEIETAILALSGDYLDDTLKLEDITDITFTITDLSAESVAFFQPLINKMNSAILGVSAIDEKAQRCTLSLTFDHRVSEGRTAARFLKELKGRLESYRPAPGTVQKEIACFKCYKTLAEDLGGTGFVHCITPQGKEGYICQSCLKGF
jgi:pyruvate/2-oxoglutarate dehydrogenase complex dihydrolipoamide acyltransferase (E2) component